MGPGMRLRRAIREDPLTNTSGRWTMEQTRPSGGLEGLSIVVTGGGTGIGAACAARFVADGATVTICGRNVDKLVAARKWIGEGAGHGGRVEHVVADVTVEDDVVRLVEAAISNGGSLNGFVANAGGGGALAPTHLQDVNEYTRVLHLNLLSTMLCVKHSVAAMVAAGGGSFVGMSSLAGSRTHPLFGAYPVAKAGIEALMRNAADEYGVVNVRFNAVAPGFIETEIMQNLPHESSVFDSYVNNTPMAGVGEPEDIANAVRFLIGPESRWVNGVTIRVDGGHHLRRGPDFSSFVEPTIGADAMVARRPVGQ
jgi:7-alpha-hydroxysteroid dehydrogenase